jgi:hypothetical protein
VFLQEAQDALAKKADAEKAVKGIEDVIERQNDNHEALESKLDTVTTTVIKAMKEELEKQSSICELHSLEGVRPSLMRFKTSQIPATPKTSAP